MLTEDKFNKGVLINEYVKHNIQYNKQMLFDIVCANMADRLLNMQPHSSELTEEQRYKLQVLINK